MLYITAKRKDVETEPDMPLYSGSRSNVFVVLPVGTYDIKARIHEEAGTYAEADAAVDFKAYVPTESEYWGYDKTADMKYHSEVGDSDRVTQMMIADVRHPYLIRWKSCHNILTPHRPRSRETLVTSIRPVNWKRRMISSSTLKAPT